MLSPLPHSQPCGWAQGDPAASSTYYMRLSTDPSCLDSWSFQLLAAQLLLDSKSSMQLYKFLFPCKEQASKASEEGYIRYGSYSLFLNYFPSEKQYMDYNADKIISIPDWEFWKDSGGNQEKVG